MILGVAARARGCEIRGMSVGSTYVCPATSRIREAEVGSTNGTDGRTGGTDGWTDGRASDAANEYL